MNARRRRLIEVAEGMAAADLRLDAQLRIAAWTPAERAAALGEHHQLIVTRLRHRLRRVDRFPGGADEWITRLRPETATRLLELGELGRLLVERGLGSGLA